VREQVEADDDREELDHPGALKIERYSFVYMKKMFFDTSFTQIQGTTKLMGDQGFQIFFLRF
jgi:hypothetical protein